MHLFPADYDLKGGIYQPRDIGQTPAFTYTDGENFEADIGKIIEESKDRSLFSDELRRAIWDWRSACHLSPVRANILRPLESICRGTTLELGSGCGIITRYLGELGGDVVALEASGHRAAITRERTADLSNVSVVCERIEDFDGGAKFDLVTMIGVLQYARMFSHCESDAELVFLQNAARQIKDSGVVVISIQNKMALKYFSGFPEPNVDQPFYGIENRYGPNDIVRFGLNEMKSLLGKAGLPHSTFLFPFPDYHMPVSIMSPAAMQGETPFSPLPLIALSVGRDRARPDWIRPSFSLERAWESVYTNGLAAHLANSFLIIAGKTPESIAALQQANTLAWHFSVERHPAFAAAKSFERADSRVEVKRQRLVSCEFPSVPVRHHADDEEYVPGRLWWSELVAIINRPGWTSIEICNWARTWLDAVCREAGISSPAALSLGTQLPGSMFDHTPLNCIQTDGGELRFIDKEWEIKSPLHLSYLVLRGMLGSLSSVGSCAEPADGTPLNILDLVREALQTQSIVISDQHVEEYLAHESAIQHWVNQGVDGGLDTGWTTYVKTVALVVRPQIRSVLTVGEPPLAPPPPSQLGLLHEQMLNVERHIQQVEGRMLQTEGRIDHVGASQANSALAVDSAMGRLVEQHAASADVSIALQAEVAELRGRVIELSEGLTIRMLRKIKHILKKLVRSHS